MNIEQQERPSPMDVKEEEEEEEEEIIYVGEFENRETTSVHHRNLNQELINFEQSLVLNHETTNTIIKSGFDQSTTFLDKWRTQINLIHLNYEKNIKDLKDEKQQVEIQVEQLKGNVNELRVVVEELKTEKEQLETDLKVSKEIADARAQVLEEMTKQKEEMEKRAKDAVEELNIMNATHNDISSSDSNKRRYDDSDLNDSAYYSQSSSTASSSPTFSPKITDINTPKKSKLAPQAGASCSFNSSSKETTSHSAVQKSAKEQAEKILNEFDDEDPLALQIIEHLSILWYNKSGNPSNCPIVVTKKLIQHCVRNDGVDKAISLIQKQNLVTCHFNKRPVVIELCSLSKKIWEHLSMKVLSNKPKIERILNNLLSGTSEKKLQDSRYRPATFIGLYKLLLRCSSTLAKEKERSVISLKKKIACYLKSSDQDTAHEILESCFRALIDIRDSNDDEEDEEDDDELNLEITIVRREIAGILLSKKKFQEANDIYEQVCSAYCSHFGPQSDEAKEVNSEYHDTLWEVGKKEEALAIYKVYGKYMKDKRQYSAKSYNTGESKYKKEEKK